MALEVDSHLVAKEKIPRCLSPVSVAAWDPGIDIEKGNLDKSEVPSPLLLVELLLVGGRDNDECVASSRCSLDDDGWPKDFGTVLTDGRTYHDWVYWKHKAEMQNLVRDLRPP